MKRIFNQKFSDENYEIRVLLEVQDPETRTFHLKDLKVEHFDLWSEKENKDL